MTYAVFDTEGTGLTRKHAGLGEACSIADNGDEVIQIGGLLLDGGLNPYRAFCYYCDCLLPESNPRARAVHNIYMAEVRRAVPNIFLEEVLCRYLPEFFGDDICFIGYNAPFDIQLVAQSVRNFYIPFREARPVVSKIPRAGRWYLDTMAYLPKRRKLSSLYGQLTPARDLFFQDYGGRLTLETNAADILETTWARHHNSLFDAIETYLLFKTEIIGKKVLVGRR